MTRPETRVAAPGSTVPYPVLDRVFFVVGGVSAVWLSSLLLQESFQWGWAQLWFLVVFWALLAYLVLPRLHRILTHVYVPDYFIGRARTSDGLLGDPVNVALLGSEPQLHAVMQAGGWTLADDVTLTSSRRIVVSTILRRSYLQAPVSPMFLFGRQQDFAYQQEIDGTPGKRHHVRFWRCPPGWLLPGGLAADWLAAGTYDRRVGLSLFTLQITHKIDGHTDGERDHIIGSIAQADTAAEVRIIRDFSAGYHTRNGGGDSIATDGDLPIVDLRRTAAPPTPSGPPSDSRDKRPAAIVVGAALAAARAAAAGLLALSLVIFPQEHIDALLLSGGAREPNGGLTSGQAGLIFTATVVAVVLFAGTELMLAWLVFLGRGRARTLTMVLSTVAIGLQAAAVLTGGPGITLRSNLPGLTIDILLVLALSSDRARTYALRAHKEPKRDSSRPGGRTPF